MKNRTNPTIIIAPIVPPTIGQGTVVCGAGGVGVGGVGCDGVCGAGVVGVGGVGCGVVCGAGGVGVGVVGCGRRPPALIAQSTSNPLDKPVLPEVAPVKMML